MLVRIGAALGSFLILATLALPAGAEIIGEVDTAFRWLGKDDRVVVEAFDDPKVQGVTCFVSRARTGGVKGTIGLAEDTSDASIACRQIGDTISFTGDLSAVLAGRSP
ncbi:MAG: CreA family protein, partial [Lautropia sp.]